MNLPNPDASIGELCEFALSFNGYAYVNGGPEKLVDLWDKVISLLNENKLSEVSADDIRACLFFQQRTDRWNDDYDIQSYQDLVEYLREKEKE